jgi:branched-chain amino acid transport system substrate-binding protein
MRAMRRGRVALLSLTGLVAAGCGGGTATSSSGNTSPVVIGISISLTGDFSDSGKADQRGYLVWQDYINSHGGMLGRQVQLKIVDDASNPDTVVTNYENLITKDKVDLVFGPFSTLLTAPSALVAKRYGYAFPDPADGAPKTLNEHLNNFFLIQPAGPLDTGVAFVRYIMSLPPSQRPQTAAYANLDDPFLTPAVAEVQKAFEDAGIKTVYNTIYPAENIQMTPIVASMAAQHPDVVVGGTMEADSFDMTKAMVTERFSPKFLFFMNGASDAAVYPANVGANNVEGIFSAIGWYPQEKSTGNSDFVAAYIHKYGGTSDQISGDSAEAYSIGQVINEAVNKVGAIDNAKIIAALHANTWPSIQGPLAWDSDGKPTGSLLLVEWISGKLEVVYPPSSATHAPEIPKPAWPS